MNGKKFTKGANLRYRHSPPFIAPFNRCFVNVAKANCQAQYVEECNGTNWGLLQRMEHLAYMDANEVTAFLLGTSNLIDVLAV